MLIILSNWSTTANANKKKKYLHARNRLILVYGLSRSSYRIAVRRYANNSWMFLFSHMRRLAASMTPIRLFYDRTAMWIRLLVIMCMDRTDAPHRFTTLFALFLSCILSWSWPLTTLFKSCLDSFACTAILLSTHSLEEWLGVVTDYNLPYMQNWFDWANDRKNAR